MIDRLINFGIDSGEAIQILRYTVDDVVTQAQYDARIEERAYMTSRVDELPKGIAQRTPEWYAAREGLITASNFHKAAAKPEQYVREKLKDKPFLGSDATRWGVKYEDVAGLLYSYYNNTEVIEYGLLLHPTIAHLGASPDGITPYGVMVEIKCPYSKTLKDIPDEYAAQMLGQMACCELTECDFVVCRVRELSLSECGEAMATTADVARYGAVATKTDGSFVFSKPGDKFIDLVNFRDVNEGNGSGVTFHNIFDFTVTRVSKNGVAWEKMTSQLAHTWATLKAAKEDKDISKPDVATSDNNHTFSFKMF
jgi:putative phage-type endonuclease